MTNENAPLTRGMRNAECGARNENATGTKTVLTMNREHRTSNAVIRKRINDGAHGVTRPTKVQGGGSQEQCGDAP